MKEKLATPNYNVNIQGRRRNGSIWRRILQLATILGIIALVALLLNVINGAFGYTVLEAYSRKRAWTLPSWLWMAFRLRTKTRNS
jgi:hypothetical protein